jgi:hypothetical protein
MGENTRFLFFRWGFRAITGRRARRIYLLAVVLILVLTTAFRIRSYVMARKTQSVLGGLAVVRIDQTTEEQLVKTMPYLIKRDWKAGTTIQRYYYTSISNESDQLIPRFLVYSWVIPEGGKNALAEVAYLLGYRYMSFDASVLVQDGRVTEVSYGLAREWSRPRAGTYFVSARSAHGFWRPMHMALAVSSVEDRSPQYRPVGGKEGLHVVFTNDAPAETTTRAFQLTLACFWSLRGCDDAREIAPLVWQDVQSVQKTTYQQLISGKCPDSIVEGRMKYLPDVSVLRLEVTGSRRIDVNEEGMTTEDWVTDYEVKELLRGRKAGLSWKDVRLPKTIPSPTNPKESIAYQIWPQTKIGSQVLFFGNIDFSSCRIIPATPSTLDIVRKTPVPPKRPEDQILTGLM